MKKIRYCGRHALSKSRDGAHRNSSQIYLVKLSGNLHKGSDQTFTPQCTERRDLIGYSAEIQNVG